MFDAEKRRAVVRKFRYIEPGHGVDSLTVHEKEELRIDFDIEVEDFYVIAPLTQKEWGRIRDEKILSADNKHFV